MILFYWYSNKYLKLLSRLKFTSHELLCFQSDLIGSVGVWLVVVGRSVFKGMALVVDSGGYLIYHGWEPVLYQPAIGVHRHHLLIERLFNFAEVLLPNFIEDWLDLFLMLKKALLNLLFNNPEHLGVAHGANLLLLGLIVWGWARRMTLRRLHVIMFLLRFYCW